MKTSFDILQFLCNLLKAIHFKKIILIISLKRIFPIKINCSGDVPIKFEEKHSGEHANALAMLLAHKLPCRNAIRDRIHAFICLHCLLQNHALLRDMVQQKTYFYIQLFPMQEE